MKYLFNTDELNSIYQDLKDLKSFEALGRKWGIKGETLKRHLKKAGFQVDNNHDYFENIDTQAKAYYLGLFIADGCIHKKVKNNLTRLSIGLIEPDSYILNGLCRETLGCRSLKIYKNTGSFCKHKVGVWHISSDKMAADLYKLGVGYRKTYDSNFRIPNLSPDFIPHFIRGLFDGDGWVTNKKKTFQVSAHILSTSKLLLTDIQKYLQQYNIKFKIRASKEGTKTSMGTRNIRIYSGDVEDITSLVAFYNLLYKNAEVFLERKRYKFQIETLTEKLIPHVGETCPSCDSTQTWKRNYYKDKIYHSCQNCGHRFNTKVSGNTVLTHEPKEL